MEPLDLPTEQFGRIETDDNFTIHYQSGKWLVWYNTWPKGMSSYACPVLTKSSEYWMVQQQGEMCPDGCNRVLSEPGYFKSLDAAIDFAKKIVKADHYDHKMSINDFQTKVRAISRTETPEHVELSLRNVEY